MLITMKETRRVSEDGFHTRELMKGESYELAHNAACTVINNGWGFQDAEDALRARLEHENFYKRKQA